MEIENYPSNSDKVRTLRTAPNTSEKEDKKKVEKVTTGKAVVKKKSAGRKFFDSFISEDARSVKDYVVGDILLPTLKDTIIDMVTNSISMLLNGGESNRSSRNRRGGGTYISYEKYSDSPRRRSEPIRRSSYSFDDILFDRRADAEEVLDTLLSIIDSYGSASVADMYDASDVPSQYTDNKYGWFDLSSAYVRRARDGFVICLPKPVVLD